MASTAQWPANSESSSARPSTSATWNLARRRASSGAHQRSSTGHGPAQPTISINPPGSAGPFSSRRLAGSPVNSSRALTPTGAPDRSSTTAGSGWASTSAGAGRGKRPGQGGRAAGGRLARFRPPVERVVPPVTASGGIPAASSSAGEVVACADSAARAGVPARVELEALWAGVGAGLRAGTELGARARLGGRFRAGVGSGAGVGSKAEVGSEAALEAEAALGSRAWVGLEAEVGLGAGAGVEVDVGVGFEAGVGFETKVGARSGIKARFGPDTAVGDGAGVARAGSGVGTDGGADREAGAEDRLAAAADDRHAARSDTEADVATGGDVAPVEVAARAAARDRTEPEWES